MIKTVLLDIDGVVTDGSVYINPLGEELKRVLFDDIDAIFRLKRLGIKLGFITGESGAFPLYFKKRFTPDYFIDGCKDKKSAFLDLCSKENLVFDETCYVGDSRKDSALLSLLKWSFVPSDSEEQVKSSAQHILNARRGEPLVATLFVFLEEHKLIPRSDT